MRFPLTPKPVASLNGFATRLLSTWVYFSFRVLNSGLESRLPEVCRQRLGVLHILLHLLIYTPSNGSSPRCGTGPLALDGSASVKSLSLGQPSQREEGSGRG